MTASHTDYPVQLTILDKLLSEESFTELTYSQPASVVKKFYQSIQQDLENLLNTKKSLILNLGEYKELKNSVLNYGMDDFWGMTFDIEAGREKLRSSVEEAIKLYEPRLKEVQVFLNENNGSLSNNISFRIEAYANFGQTYDSVIFSSTFEPRSKRFLVVSENE